MKKYLLFSLLALLSASILVNAQTADLLLDFAYVLNTEGTGVVIREYKEKAKKVIVPAIIEDFPVVCCKLRHKWETVSVVLPDSCTEFYFEGCNSLEKVILPKELKTISWNCFKGCKALKAITLPDGLEKLTFMLFRNPGWHL